MEKLTKKLPKLLEKYKYALLIVLLGLCLLAIPGKKTTSAPAATESPTVSDTTQAELEAILATIQGAGKVRVMLTEAVGRQTVYQTDEDSDTGESTRSVRRDTVIVSDSARGESALVAQVNPPQYLGALVVCQGADSAAVRLAIVEAVSKVTGLGANCISVLKMNGR